MEIKVRNLDKSIVAALDDRAASQHKSRNEYLREQLTLLAQYPALQEQEDRYHSLVETLLLVVQQNTETLEQLIRKGGTKLDRSENPQKPAAFPKGK